MQNEAWTELQTCVYKIQLSFMASHYDYLKVKFIKMENVLVRYYVGTSLANVEGTLMTEGSGSTIKVPFPYSLYIAI